VVEKGEDLPLASGVSNWTSKGIWLIHMLRNLMNAVDSARDTRFTGWLNEVVRDMNAGPFSNGDFQRLAEQYFGYDLDWFFRHWLYGSGLPEYNVEYSTIQEDDGYYVSMKIVTEGTGDNFLMPVLIRIDLPGGPALENCFVATKYQDYRLGPYADEPISVHFNKYLSVLSRDKIKRAD
jgi:aminopeptidase N